MNEMKVLRSTILFLILSFVFLTGFGQERKYSVSNAHAHNDYNHPLPFFTAYGAGFGSIEADVFLRNGQLYVAHDTAGIDPERTLESLYLDPLDKAIKKNRGHAYPDKRKRLLLLVDLKTAAEATLDVLLQILQRYENLTSCPTLKIVITGNQPAASQLISYPSYICFDGRLDRSYTGDALKKITLFSEDFRNYSSWKGEGVLDPAEMKKLKQAIARAHEQHRPIRFWAAPDLPRAWLQLMELHVDYLNTDKIAGLSSFLEKKAGKKF
jgi:alkaline phosphatase